MFIHHIFGGPGGVKRENEEVHWVSVSVTSNMLADFIELDFNLFRDATVRDSISFHFIRHTLQVPPPPNYVFSE